jgi:hypothetical protein
MTLVGGDENEAWWLDIWLRCWIRVWRSSYVRERRELMAHEQPDIGGEG